MSTRNKIQAQAEAFGWNLVEDKPFDLRFERPGKFTAQQAAMVATLPPEEQYPPREAVHVSFTAAGGIYTGHRSTPRHQAILTGKFVDGEDTVGPGRLAQVMAWLARPVEASA